MDNGLIQEKPKEQLVYYPKSNTFRKDLDNKATMRGFDAYVEGEKKNRLTRSIERLSRHTNLSEDELQRLKAKVVVDETYGRPCFMAASFPQNATESDTTISGLISPITREVISSSASVDETRSSVA